MSIGWKVGCSLHNHLGECRAGSLNSHSADLPSILLTLEFGDYFTTRNEKHLGSERFSGEVP